MKELKKDKLILEEEIYKLIKAFEEKYGVEVYDIIPSHERTIGGDVMITSIMTDVRL